MGQKVASIRSKMLLPPVQWFGGLDGSSLGFWKRKVCLENTPAWQLSWCAMAAQNVSSFYPSTQQNLVFGVTMNHILSGWCSWFHHSTDSTAVWGDGVKLSTICELLYWLRSLWNLWQNLWKIPVMIWGQKGCARRHAKTTPRDAKMLVGTEE